MSEANTALQLVAVVEAKEGERDTVRSACIDLIEPTRLEEGCMQYIFHEDIENKNTFVFYEVWKSHAAWQEHMQSEHIARHKEATANRVASVRIHQLNECDA